MCRAIGSRMHETSRREERMGCSVEKEQGHERMMEIDFGVTMDDERRTDLGEVDLGVLGIYIESTISRPPPMSSPPIRSLPGWCEARSCRPLASDFRCVPDLLRRRLDLPLCVRGRSRDPALRLPSAPAPHTRRTPPRITPQRDMFEGGDHVARLTFPTHPLAVNHPTNFGVQATVKPALNGNNAVLWIAYAIATSAHIARLP